MNIVPESSSGEATPSHLDRLLDGSFREVDIQFNLVRTEGQESRGLDVVNRDEGRFLVTSPSSQESEELVRLALGDQAILSAVERGEHYSIYKVPQGARLLARTLQNPPYKAPYMRFLAARADKLLEKLEGIDPNAFGVTPERIAIGHNGDNEETSEDDTFLVVVPPLDDPAATHKARDEERDNTLRFLRERARSTRTSTQRELGALSLGVEEYEKLKAVKRADVWDWLIERHPR